MPVPPEKVAQLLLALVNHGFTIVPLGRAFDHDLYETSAGYTRNPWDASCFPDLERSPIAYYDAPNARIRVRYGSDVDPSTLYHLYLTLQEIGLKVSVFEDG